MSTEKLICEFKGCNSYASEYVYPIIDEDEDDYPIAYYCDDHAVEHGFCLGCGMFCAGLESFHFPLPGQPKGYCYDCYLDLKADFKEDDEEDDYDTYFYP